MGSQEIMSGNLQVFKNGLINRSWQSRWCVLYDGSGARLEYFDNQEGMNRQSAHKKVVLLEKISKIEKIQPKQSNFPFDVTVKSGKLSFMARSPSECEGWIQAFTRIMNQEMGLTSPPVAIASADHSSSGLVDNILYESTELVTKFPVTLVESESEAAKSKDLVGKHYFLAVGRQGYDLFEAQGQTSLHHWPFRHVRKFGATEEHFILLGGSRCEEWAGEYKFLTSEGQAIKGAVDRMTKLLAPSANLAAAFQNEGPPPVKEKPVPQPERGSTSEIGGAASKHETLLSGGDRDASRAPPSPGGIFQGPTAEYMAELDDKLYEYTKARPNLDFRHPKHQDKMQGKVSAPTPGSVASAAHSNQNKVPLQPTNSHPSVEMNEQKSQPLARAQSADYDKAQRKKAKEDKKREEKERKEQEKREKEQQEKERKEQEKREKEEKKKKSREKSKTKSSTMSKATAMLAHVNVNTYEEVDVPSPPLQDKQAQDVENAYTEADFRPQPPADHAASRGHIYSEPDLAFATASVAPAKPPQAVYSQVMKHRNEAWKEFGRVEDNLHEEDYDRIKLAAKEAEQTMLPSVIPAAADDEDETYDSLALPSVHRDRPSTKTNSDVDNVYGLASAVPAMSSQLSSAADGESGYEDAEIVNATATALQRNTNYNPSHNYEEPDFRSMSSPEEEEDPYTNA